MFFLIPIIVGGLVIRAVAYNKKRNRDSRDEIEMYENYGVRPPMQLDPRQGSLNNIQAQDPIFKEYDRGLLKYAFLLLLLL